MTPPPTLFCLLISCLFGKSNLGVTECHVVRSEWLCVVIEMADDDNYSLDTDLDHVCLPLL